MPSPRRDHRGRRVLPLGLPTAALAAGAITALLATTAPAGPGGAGPDPAAATSGGVGGADGGGVIDPLTPRSPVTTARPPSPESDPHDPGTAAARTRDAAAPPTGLAAEGWLVAGGHSPVAGASGPLVTYTVELAVDPHRDVGVDGFAAAVTATLSDPDRGWTAGGRWRLQRVDDPTAARIRVLLAEPGEVDELCARAGLDTRGLFSCWNGTFAALNVDRWVDGVAHVDDLDLYRTYLVNHEVGHGLGYGHEPCPSPGAVAPVMMQLTVATEGCVPNGVPFP